MITIKIKPILRLQSRSYRDILIHSVHKHGRPVPRCVTHCTHSLTHTHALRWACGTPRRSTGTKGRHTRVPTFSVPESWERETTEYTWDTAKAHTHTHAHTLNPTCESDIYTFVVVSKARHDSERLGCNVLLTGGTMFWYSIHLFFSLCPTTEGVSGGRADWLLPTWKIQPDLQLKDVSTYHSQYECARSLQFHITCRFFQNDIKISFLAGLAHLLLLWQ